LENRERGEEKRRKEIEILKKFCFFGKSLSFKAQDPYLNEFLFMKITPSYKVNAASASPSVRTRGLCPFSTTWAEGGAKLKAKIEA